MEPLLIGGGIFAALIALFVWMGKKGARQARARAAASAKAIEEHGWKITANAPALVDFADEPPFRQGRERGATQVVRAKHAGYSFTTFQYGYVTESKDAQGQVQRSHHGYAVAGIKIKGEISGIKIMPEGLWDGKYDLDVESDDFNKKWRVQAADKRFAHALLSPTVIALLVDRETPTMPIVFEPGRIWTYRAGGHDFGTLAKRLEVLAGIAEEIPAFVFTEAKAAKQLDKYVEPAKLESDPLPTGPKTGSARDSGRSLGGRSAAPSASGRSSGGTARRSGWRPGGGTSRGGWFGGGRSSGRSRGGARRSSSSSRRSSGGRSRGGSSRRRGGRSRGGR